MFRSHNNGPNHIIYLLLRHSDLEFKLLIYKNGLQYNMFHKSLNHYRNVHLYNSGLLHNQHMPFQINTFRMNTMANI